MQYKTHNVYENSESQTFDAFKCMIFIAIDQQMV